MTYQFTWEPAPPDGSRRERRYVAAFAAGVGAVFVGSVLAQLALGLAVGLLAPELLRQMWFQILASSVCLYGGGMVPGWLILRRLPTEPIGSRAVRPLSLAAAVSVAVTFLLVGSYAGTLVNFLITLLTGVEQTNPVETIASGTPIGVLAVCTVLLAPPAEELFFRRVVIDRLRRYGDVPAILISAVIFGLAHGNFSQFFYAFLLGLVFGALYCATGRLRYGIALHMGINFFGSVWSTLLVRRVGTDVSVAALLGDPIAFGMYAVDLAVYGLAVLAFIPSLVVLLRRFRPRRWHNPYSAAQWGKIVFLNPAVWALAAVFVVRFLL